MKQIHTRLLQCPAGELIIGDYDGNLCLCDWVAGRRHEANLARIRRCLKAEFHPGDTPLIQKSISQLIEYFQGNRLEFSLPLIFSGTDFQCRVWRELERIPYGVSISYASLANRIGSPRAIRAVASAVANNPISIIVPCHRVIGSNGTLTGYAGGIPAKQLLLSLEQKA